MNYRKGDVVRLSYEATLTADVEEGDRAAFVHAGLMGSGDYRVPTDFIQEIIQKKDHPSDDPIGIVRGRDQELAIKVRPDYWVFLRLTEGEPLQFTDHEMTGYDRVPYAEVQRVFEHNSGLRIVEDGEGDFWYELRPDQFYLSDTTGERQSAVERSGDRNWEPVRFSHIETEYGIRRVTR